MSHSDSGLCDHIGYWLRRLSDEVHVGFERKLANRGVTVAQWNVLVTLYRGEAETVGGIAGFIETDIAAASRLVDRLVDKGLVVRQVDPTSRRRVPLALTPAARKLVPVLVDLADENDAAYFGSLSPDQRDQLVALLQSLLASSPRPTTKEDARP